MWGWSGVSNSYNTSNKTSDIKAGVTGLSDYKWITGGNQYYDNFGVYGYVGDGRSEGTGVLGWGKGHRGHGVIGIAEETYETYTHAGVMGVVNEDDTSHADFKTNTPLFPANKKKGVIGVLGIAKKNIGVWGESIEKFGVVGTTDEEYTKNDLPSQGYGVLAMGNTSSAFLGISDSASGTIGQSKSSMPTDAGIEAVGMNDRDKAAALNISNGAVIVTTSDTINGDKPAGTIDGLMPVLIPYHTSDFPCPNCIHAHASTQVGFVTLQNKYLKANHSVLLLTVENLRSAFYTSIVGISDGSATIRIATNDMTYDPFSSFPSKLHYWIVNEY